VHVIGDLVGELDGRVGESGCGEALKVFTLGERAGDAPHV
jgi:hypothetical protein